MSNLHSFMSIKCILIFNCDIKCKGLIKLIQESNLYRDFVREQYRSKKGYRGIQ